MKLFTPSWVKPGTYAENLSLLSHDKDISGVELLFFKFDAEAEMLLEKELPLIQSYGERFEFSCHLPKLTEERTDVLIRTLSPLVTQFIFHAPKENMHDFLNRFEHLKTCTNKKLVLEYTNKALFYELEKELPELFICADTGHLLLDNQNPYSWIQMRKNKLAHIHLHAVKNGKDHALLQSTDTWLLELIPFLKDYEGIIELELFDYEQILQSKEILLKLINT